MQVHSSEQIYKLDKETDRKAGILKIDKVNLTKKTGLGRHCALRRRQARPPRLSRNLVYSGEKRIAQHDGGFAGGAGADHRQADPRQFTDATKIVARLRRQIT